MKENSYIKEIIENGKVDLEEYNLSMSKLIYMLSVYYGARSTKVNETMSLLFSDFQELKWNKFINSSCMFVKTKKPTLKEYESLKLYESEYQMILDCKTLKHQKLLFSCIMFAKYINKQVDSGLYRIDSKYTTKQIFDFANISGTKFDKNVMINDLWEEKKLEQNYINNDNTLFVKLGDKTEKVVFEITEFSNLGNKLVTFMKSDYKQCEVCGKLIKIKSKTKPEKYCEKCSEDIRQEKRVLYNSKYYDKIKESDN